jgi:sigma-B regulation protein RsbU (phosphoserine phosphatase)
MFVQLADSYDYFEREWFKKPLETGKPLWSDPYYDEGGGDTLMVTYSHPFMKENLKPTKENVKGIITADISLEHLTEMVSGIRVEKTGYAFLLSNKGDLIVWPHTDLIMKETISSLADRLGDPKLGSIGEAMLKQESGFLDAGLSLMAKESFLAFSSLPDFGWRLGVVIPKDELFEQTYALEQILLIVGVAGILLLSTASLMVARSVSAPLNRMAHVTQRVGEGNFDVDLPEKDRLDEVGQLARSFMSMSRSLRSYMKDLTQATANKERIESELRIAGDIQKSMLPSSFPAFPNRNDFDIYALMRPAKEVGGDFFDFFLLDDDHLCISVGDVSGKGTPAALFMSVTKYLIEACTTVDTPIDETLEKINKLLARNNANCMFVTVFLGILNLNSGVFIYANAGHNSPLIWTNGAPVAFLELVGGPLLGIMEPGLFRVGKTTLVPNGGLLVYTDGVTEAFNVEGEPFSDEKLLNTVESIRGDDAKSITGKVLTEIDEFCGAVPQSDDITIMVLNYTPDRKDTGRLN